MIMRNVYTYCYFQQLESILNNVVGELCTFAERISALKKNFGSCEAGRYFLFKTEPLFDSLTQCMFRKSLILQDMAMDSSHSMPEEYRKRYEQVSSLDTVNRRSRAADTLLLESLFDGLLFWKWVNLVYSLRF